MAAAVLVFTYRIRSEAFIEVNLAGRRRTLTFEHRACWIEVPRLEPGVEAATSITDGRLHASRDGKVAIISTGAIRIGVEADKKILRQAGQINVVVDDCRRIADNLLIKLTALLGSRGHQYSLGLVEQDIEEIEEPVLIDGRGRHQNVAHPRSRAHFSSWDHQSVSVEMFDVFINEIRAGVDLHEVYRLLADAYYLCHSSSLAELRHAALLGGTACEVAAKQLIRDLSDSSQRPIVDALLTRKPHVVFILNEGCFAIKGRRLRDELPLVSNRLEQLQSYRNKVAHEGVLPAATGSEQIRVGLDAAVQAIEWFRST